MKKSASVILIVSLFGSSGCVRNKINGKTAVANAIAASINSSPKQPQFIDGIAVIVGKEYKEFMGTWTHDSTGKLTRHGFSYKCTLSFVLKEDFRSYVYDYPSDGKLYAFEGDGSYFADACKLPIGTTGIITIDRITKEVLQITDIKLP